MYRITVLFLLFNSAVYSQIPLFPDLSEHSRPPQNNTLSLIHPLPVSGKITSVSFYGGTITALSVNTVKETYTEILHSTNKGFTWEVTEVPEGIILNQIEYTDSVIWTAGFKQDGVPSAARGYLFSSSDDAGTWDTLLTFPAVMTGSRVPLQIRFVPPYAFVFYTSPDDLSDHILYTADYGKTFKEIIKPSSRTDEVVDFVSSSSVWKISTAASPSEKFSVSFSADTGNTWKEVFTDNLNTAGTDFITDKKGVIAGYQEGGVYAFATSDGGNTWMKSGIEIPSGCTVNNILIAARDTGSYCAAVELYNSKHVFTNFYLSTDGGRSFAYTTMIDGLRPAGTFFFPKQPPLTYPENPFAVPALITGSFGEMYITGDRTKHWYRIHRLALRNDFTDIDFTDEENGFVIGNSFSDIYSIPAFGYSSLIRTPNGGDLWLVNALDTTLMLTGISFIDSAKGYLAGVKTDDPHTSAILYTSDQAFTWKKTEVPGRIDQIFFISEKRGWALGRKPHEEAPLLLRTFDGENWSISPHPLPVNSLLNRICMSDSLYGFIAGEEGVILKTTDGGNIWEKLILDPDASMGTALSSIKDICFTGRLNGYAAGVKNVPLSPYSIGFILKTTDGGSTWSMREFEEFTLPRRITFYDIKNGFISGSPSWYTTDGGEEWKMPDGYTRLNDFVYVNSRSGFASAPNGRIYKFDSGEITAAEGIHTAPKGFTLAQNYPNPFNASTVINFNLPAPQRVTLELYNILGSRTAVIADAEYPAGSHNVKLSVHGLPSGIYFYTLRAGSFTQTRKLVHLK